MIDPQHQEKLDALHATEDAARREQQRQRQLNQPPTGKSASQAPSHTQSPTRSHLHLDTTDAAQPAESAHASDMGTGAAVTVISATNDGTDSSAPPPVAAPTDAETGARPLLSPTEELRRLIQNEIRFANIASHHSRASGFHADPHRLKRLPTAAGDSSDDEARRGGGGGGSRSGDDGDGGRSRGHSFHRQSSQWQTDGAHSVDAAGYTAFAAFAEMRSTHDEGGDRGGDGTAPGSALPDANRIPCVVYSSMLGSFSIYPPIFLTV
jgi:hypothetical protein